MGAPVSVVMTIDTGVPGLHGPFSPKEGRALAHFTAFLPLRHAAEGWGAKARGGWRGDPKNGVSWT